MARDTSYFQITIIYPQDAIHVRVIDFFKKIWLSYHTACMVNLTIVIF